MSNRKKKRKKALGMNEDRNMRERGRVRNINTEYDRLVELLGGVVVQPGKERKRATAAKEKPSKTKLRKEDILYEAANYLQGLMEELEDVKNSMAKDMKDIEFSGSSIFTDSSPPPPAPDPPVVTTTTTIPESELKCDEMFEAIVPADDNDDRIVTTTSSLNTVGHDQLEQIEEEVEGQQQEPMSAAAGLNCMQQMGSNGQSSHHHHQLHSQSHHHHPGLQQQWRGPSPPQQCMPPVAFLPFSPEDSPTPLGPNLQNTAEISSPEQVPLPSSTVSALPIPDTISPELLQLPHCFQLWFSSNGSPCPDSTSSGCLMSPLSPYLPPPLAIAGEHTPHCPPVYQELEP